jgi:hypothetical protein
VIFLGVDPGKSGGISRHDGDVIFAQGFTNKTPMDIYTIIKEFSADGKCVAMIEKVHSMPKQGVKSSFTFGQNYGFLLGCLTALEIPFEYVSPQKWQKYLSCRTGGNKNVSKQKAQELFPQLKITHAVADALLIGEYLKRTYYSNIDLEL